MRGIDSRARPTFEIEARELRSALGLIAGIDEAGRGPLAGPVVAAAVVLDPGNLPDGIDDSKALDPDEREEIFAAIMAAALDVGVGVASVARIDRVNILNATLWAMASAVRGMKRQPRLAIVDGNRAPRLRCATQTVVGGDAVCLSVAAASIVAKVTRDRMMIALGGKLPVWGFERHKGYGTPEHQDAIVRHGVTAHHRRSFRPVRLALGIE